MKTPTSQRRSRGVSEKQARRTGSKEAKKSTGTGARKAPLNGRLGDEEQIAFQAELLANVSHAVLAIDPQYRITYWNAAAERLYGHTADQVLGQLAREVVRSELTTEQRAAYARELEATGRLQFESVQHDRHGNPLLIHGTCSTLRASDGRVLGYVWVNRDVSMQRRDEDQLRQQAELLELTHDAILVRDLEGRVTFWNRGAELLYGWSRAEAVGQPLQGLLHTLFAQPLAEIEAQVKRKGRWEGELVHTTRQGRPIQLASRWSLQRDAQGQPIAILEINTDITERKRGEAEIRRLNAELEQRVSDRTAELEMANHKLKQEIAERQRIEDELREAEQQANDLIRYAPTAIYEIDFRGPRFTRVNDAMCQMSGYSREELLAMDPFALLDEESQRRARARMSRARAGQVIHDPIEYTVKTKDGREIYALVKTRLVYAEGKPASVFVIAHDITERKRTEDALARSEAGFKSLYQSLPFLALVFQRRGGDFVLTDYNQAAIPFTQGGIGALVGRTARELYAARPETQEHLERAYAERTVLRREGPYRLITTGEEKYIIQNFVYVPPDQILLHIEDITERKRAEETLRESEDRLRRALSMETVGVMFFDLDGAVTDANEAFLRMSGYSREDVAQGRVRWDVMTPPEFMLASRRAFQELSTKGETTPYEKEYIRKDGSRWWGLFAARRLSENEQVKVILDITERKQAEERLRESEERFRTVLDNSLDAAYRRNLQTDHYDYISPVIERMTGLAAKEFALLSLEEVMERIHPADRARVQQAAGQTLTGETSTAAVEYRYLCEDGQYRWFSDHLSVLRDASGQPKYWVGLVRDETEHRQADERLADVNRELQRHSAELAAANKELEAFSYSVSHDLRTPLATVDGLSRLLQQEYGASLPEQAQRYLELVRTGTQQMNMLITSLLGLSRLSRHALQKQPVNMTALAGEALETLKEEEARPNLTIAVQEMPDADADPVLLKQVWVNLFANAFKFTRKREHARIEVGSGQWAVGSEQWVAGSGQSSASRDKSLPPTDSPLATVYYVRDNGVGFDMEQADRLFGVFQRLHDEEEYEGTGVGLATVARIIHRHGGRVWAEGKVGEGATFYFTLE